MLRLVVLSLVFVASCLPPQAVPTNVIVATTTREPNGLAFGFCEVVLNANWIDFQASCGMPIASVPWREHDGGRCHFYETIAVTLTTQVQAPFVAICTRMDDRPAMVGTTNVESHSKTIAWERIAAVVGLRQIPVER